MCKIVGLLKRMWSYDARETCIGQVVSIGQDQ